MSARFSRAAATALGVALLPLFLVSMPAQAKEFPQPGEPTGIAEGHDSQAWAKRHIEKEASILEIKPSQQAAWEEYAAVKLEIAASFAKQGHDFQTKDNQDASALLRHRADHLTEAARNLTKLADATEKLQAALSPEQRKVLNRLVAHHGFDHHAHHATGHEPASSTGEKSRPQQAK